MPIDFAGLMNTPAPSSAPAETSEAAEAPEQTEGTETEPAVTAGQESALGGEDEPELEAQEETVSSKLEDEAEYEIDGKKVKGSELKKGMLRQEDYTRKTQALAAERKQLTAERDEAHEARDEMLEFVQQFNDPERAVFQLRRNFPQTFDAIRDYIVEQALEEQDLDPTTLKYKRAAEQAEIDRLGREEDENYQKKKVEKTEKFKKTAELAVTFNGWIATAMTDSGLDPANERHQKLVRATIRSEFAKESWTEKHFQQAAQMVAETMGLKKDPKAQAAKDLPKVKPTGQKAPVNQPKKAKKVEKKESGSFFENLRRSNGLA